MSRKAHLIGSIGLESAEVAIKGFPPNVVIWTNFGFFSNLFINKFDEQNDIDKLEDLSIRSNKAYIYNNILFANKNSSLEADVIDFNLLSGDININMFEEKDKIKIINK